MPRHGFSKKGSSSAASTGAGRTKPGNLAGLNLELAGDHNLRVTLHAVRVNGPITRTALAAITGLTPAAIANITKRLLRDGFILEAGRQRGGRGQPATKLEVNPDGCFSVGLNVDRDHITLVVLDFLGTVRARSSREVHFASPDTVRTFFQRSIGQLMTKAGITAKHLVGVGIAFPTGITQTQLPDQPVHYGIWQSVRIDELIKDVLDIPVYVENDAAAAAIGEMQFGHGHRFQSFFYMLVTAALGGGVVADGHYYRGANGCSGEIGWLRAADRTANVRQLQHIVSLSALYLRLHEKGFRVASPQGLTRLEPSARGVVDAWIDESAEALTDALLAVNTLINPQAILIGGRLPSAVIDQLAEAANERLSRHAGQLLTVAPVMRAALAADAPAVGAGILPFSDRLLPTRDVPEQA